MMKDAEAKVMIVVINWNNKNGVLRCLFSMQKLNYPKNNYEVMVIDNGSTDGSQEAISRTFPNAILLRNKRNVGYVKAVNRGINYGIGSNVDYIWILNNDVVVDENSLKKLIEVGQKDDRIGVICPVVYSYDNPDLIDNVGYRINFWTGGLRKLKYSKDVFKNEHDEIENVDSVLGCSNLIKIAVFKKIGLFRPIYELYFEETDFNVRANKSGYRVVMVKNAKVWHRSASTMNRYIIRRAYLLLRNLFIFELFNARLRHLLFFIPYYFVIHLPYFLIYGFFYNAELKLTNSRKR